MRRYELADEQWELIADLFPPEQGNGRPVARPSLDGQLRGSHSASMGSSTHSSATTGRRNVIERSISWLKHARRIAPR